MPARRNRPVCRVSGPDFTGVRLAYDSLGPIGYNKYDSVT